jgi:hypothetical protein
MARLTAFACICVLVAWRPVDASIEKDGRHVSPPQQQLVIGTTRVTLDVDHNLVRTGDSVVATLRAYDDTAKAVAVDLVVFYSDDVWEGTEASAPKPIDLEHVTLAAAPDGGTPSTTQVKLAGSGKLNTYKIFVVPRGYDIATSYDDPAAAAIPAVAWRGNDFDISIRPHSKIVAGKGR